MRYFLFFLMSLFCFQASANSPKYFGGTWVDGQGRRVVVYQNEYKIRVESPYLQKMLVFEFDGNSVGNNPEVIYEDADTQIRQQIFWSYSNQRCSQSYYGPQKTSMTAHTTILNKRDGSSRAEKVEIYTCHNQALPKVYMHFPVHSGGFGPEVKLINQ